MSKRAVLVTGGSRGIGAAIVRAFAANGDRVAIHHRDSAKFAADVHASLPGDGHVVVQADLAEPQAVRVMVDEAAGRLGGLDIVVNNAGIYTSHPVTDVSYEEWQAAWQDTLNVNLHGPANVIWCVVRHMIPRGGGRIVNVSSRGAFRGEPNHPAYAASKAGLNALSQSLAAPLGKHGIAVTTVAPGFVETDMAADILNSPGGDEIRAQSPFNRVASTQEIAAAVVWLASPEAEWASGAILDLNGASYLRSLSGFHSILGVRRPAMSHSRAWVSNSSGTASGSIWCWRTRPWNRAVMTRTTARGGVSVRTPSPASTRETSGSSTSSCSFVIAASTSLASGLRTA
jgi:NAD(P)-dependent dehydrogenase (short-subunit alcohol dehydrogenase family)